MAVRRAPRAAPKVPEIRKGDTVVVLAGKDAGKRGTVERVIRRARPPPSVGRSVLPARRRPPVGVHASSSRASTSPSATPSRASRPGRTDRDAARSSRAASSTSPSRCRSSRVMLVCPNCGQADPRSPTRRWTTGRRVRVCRHCGEQHGGEGVTSRLHERYTAEVVPALQKQFEYAQPDARSRALDKIVVNIGLGEALHERQGARRRRSAT